MFFDPVPFSDKAIICTDQTVSRILRMNAEKDRSETDAVLWQWRPEDATGMLFEVKKTKIAAGKR